MSWHILTAAIVVDGRMVPAGQEVELTDEQEARLAPLFDDGKQAEPEQAEPESKSDDADDGKQAEHHKRHARK
jgi:hypothetical protein